MIAYLWVLSFDVTKFTHSIVDAIFYLDLEGAVSAATSSTGAAMISKGENSKGFVTQLAIVLILLLLLFGESGFVVV